LVCVTLGLRTVFNDDDDEDDEVDVAADVERILMPQINVEL